MQYHTRRAGTATRAREIAEARHATVQSPSDGRAIIRAAVADRQEPPVRRERGACSAEGVTTSGPAFQPSTSRIRWGPPGSASRSWTPSGLSVGLVGSAFKSNGGDGVLIGKNSSGLTSFPENSLTGNAGWGVEVIPATIALPSTTTITSAGYLLGMVNRKKS